jgi:hypothetical protein
MTNTYTPLIENNDHEGETWTWWIRIEGNEAVLDLLRDTIREERDADDCFEEYDLPEWPNGDRLTQDQVELLEQRSGGGYYSAHNQVFGLLVPPPALLDTSVPAFERLNDALYKGGADDWDRR